MNCTKRISKSMHYFKHMISSKWMHLPQKENDHRRLYCYLIFTCLTLTLGLILFSLHVSGQEMKKHQLQEAAISAVEQKCRTQLREQLNDLGYNNTGITVTHTIEEDGDISYQVALHHKKFTKMSSVEVSAFLSSLTEQYSTVFQEEAFFFIH